MEELDYIFFDVLFGDDITIADAFLLRFCKRTVQLYGSEAITPNMHMHCHLASCIREFGSIHSFWLLPFERYNRILEGQPTNNRSIELQLMHRFQKDNMHLHLHHEAKQWPNADHFLTLLMTFHLLSRLMSLLYRVQSQ